MTRQNSWFDPIRLKRIFLNTIFGIFEVHDVAGSIVIRRPDPFSKDWILHHLLWALFNNTGGPPAGRFDSFDDVAWQSAFELTVLGYVRAIRAALPHLRAGGGGRIVNNTSVSTKQAIDGLLLSNVFRTGLVGLGKSLARELGSDGILVNTVGAGRIDTDRITALDTMWAEKAGITREEQRAKAEGAIPLGRYGAPADFARAVVWLCSEANAYVTGQNLLIDGGMTEAY